MKKISILVPTYNEVENVEPLKYVFDHASDSLKGFSWGCTVDLSWINWRIYSEHESENYESTISRGRRED